MPACCNSRIPVFIPKLLKPALQDWIRNGVIRIVTLSEALQVCKFIYITTCTILAAKDPVRMTIHCCFKYCCFCCYQCDRRREKARVYRLSGILPVAPDVQLHKVFNFQQTVLRSAHYQSVIETQPKRTPKKQAHTPAPWPCDEEEGDILLPHCRSLSLQFSLHYDHQRHTLSAHLQHVTSLEPFAGFGKLSVTLFLTPDKKDVFEANASYKHGNTVFDRIFEFTGLSINEVIQKNLVFRVYHHMYNCSVKKRLIGTTTVPLDKKDIYGHKITKEVDRNGKTWEVSIQW